MPRIRILVAALAALALAAPAASADPHAIDAHVQAQKRNTATQAELKARGRDGVQTGSLAGTTDATTRALAQERTYSTYGVPPIEREPAPATADDDDSAPWPLIGAGFLGVALMFGAAVALIARPRRARVAA
jgi:hypothetical protein